ncbi:MAG: hypothetical protein R3234_02015 [Thermoanaerobaculia bacterium]|nr:hypothetical protein [Thermoanaerobaculia bacterium]
MRSRGWSRGARSAVWVLGALLSGVAFAGVGGLEGDDPLRGTAAIAPAVLVALWRIELWAEDQDGAGADPTIRLLEGSLLLGWLLLVVVRGSWSLPSGSEVLAGAFFLAVGWKILRTIPRLRPSLGESVPRRPPAVFFWLPLVAYLAILPWCTSQRPPDGDEPYYLLVAHSLAFDGDTDLRNNYVREDSRRYMPRALEPQLGDPVGPDGQIYSRHSALLPLVLALPYRVAGSHGAFAVMAGLTALLAWWFLRVCRRHHPDRPGGALLAWALLAFAPPVLLYSHQVWVEIPAGLLLVIGWDTVHLSPERRKRGAWILILAVVVLLTFLKLRLLIVAAPLLLLAVIRSRRGSTILWSGLILAVTAGGVLLYNQSRFGNPLRIHSVADLAFHEVSPFTVLQRELGLFFDGAFGLFAAAPLWLILVPGVLRAVRRDRGLLARLVLLLGPYFLVIASRREWFGGWSPPFRYGLLGLPLLALLLVPLWEDRRRVGPRALLAGLGALTVGLTLLWLAVPGWTYNLADGGSHLADAASRLLGLDFNRLLPSSVRPRVATWLWPSTLGLLVPLVWWRPRRQLPAAGALGLAALLLVAAGGTALTSRLPTRVLEMEDPPVVSEKGRLHPRKWAVERVRRSSGLLLPEGASLRAPVVAGGNRVVLVLRVRLIENDEHPTGLTIGDGRRTFSRWRVREGGDWVDVRSGPVRWIPGRDLHLAVGPPPEGAPRNGIVVDRVLLEWR